jgi:hypothetical protein
MPDAGLLIWAYAQSCRLVELSIGKRTLTHRLLIRTERSGLSGPKGFMLLG